MNEAGLRLGKIPTYSTLYQILNEIVDAMKLQGTTTDRCGTAALASGQQVLSVIV